jgi:hypothetical protein
LVGKRGGRGGVREIEQRGKGREIDRDERERERERERELNGLT